MDKIIAYATNKNGDGYVQQIGEFDSIEEIDIRVGMYADDVVITFQYETKEPTDTV